MLTILQLRLQPQLCHSSLCLPYFAVPLLSASYQHYKEPYKPCVCFGPLQKKMNVVFL